jgi:hypothetical protein
VHGGQFQVVFAEQENGRTVALHQRGRLPRDVRQRFGKVEPPGHGQAHLAHRRELARPPRQWVHHALAHDGETHNHRRRRADRHRKARRAKVRADQVEHLAGDEKQHPQHQHLLADLAPVPPNHEHGRQRKQQVKGHAPGAELVAQRVRPA